MFVGTVPPADQAIIDGVHRTPPGSTASLLASLSPLKDLGFSPTQAALLGFGRFPVAGPASWSDDWLAPRFGADGSFRFHMGNDVVAACGTPIRAASEGTVRPGSDPAGGNNVEVIEADGTYLYMAHLSAYPVGQSSGQHVAVGDVIGFVGQTGAATGCHLHLEIHPRGGQAVDPKAFLDAWAAEATAAAPLLVDARRADHGLAPVGAPLPPSGVALAGPTDPNAGPTDPNAGPTDPNAGPPSPPSPQPPLDHLWAAALSPGVGALALAADHPAPAAIAAPPAAPPASVRVAFAGRTHTGGRAATGALAGFALLALLVVGAAAWRSRATPQV